MSHWAEISLPFILFVMNPLVGAALVQAGSQLVGGAMTTKAQNDANRDNRILFHEQMRFNRDEAEKARRAQSISSQLREMRLGGLNPADASSTVSSSPVSASQNALPDIKPQDGLGRAISSAFARMDIAQMRNLEANTRKTEEETEGVKYTNEILASDAKFRDAWNENNLKLSSSQAELNFVNANNIKVEQPEKVALLRAQAKEALQHVDSMAKDMDLLEAKISEIEQNKKESEQRIQNLQQEIKESISRCIKNEADSNLSKSMSAYYDQMWEKVRVDVAKGWIDVNIGDINYRIEKAREGLVKGQIELNKEYLEDDKDIQMIAPFVPIISRALGVALGAMTK